MGLPDMAAILLTTDRRETPGGNRHAAKINPLNHKVSRWAPMLPCSMFRVLCVAYLARLRRTGPDHNSPLFAGS